MLGSDPPPLPPARQVGQPQPKPPSRHGDQGGGGGGWANEPPCHPPPPPPQSNFLPAQWLQRDARKQMAEQFVKTFPLFVVFSCSVST